MMKDLRDAVIETLVDMATKNEVNLAVCVSDSTSTAKIGPFMSKFPEKVVNVGIAEQDLVGIAAGLSLSGEIVPVTMNAACFLTARANEQIRNDVCYANTNVKLIGLNGGVAYGPLGSTHHSIEDISVFQNFGNIEVFAPCDAPEASAITRYAMKSGRPTYIRLDNQAFPIFHDDNYRFTPGALDLLYDGSGGSIVFALGSVVYEAMQAAKMHSDKSPTIVNMSSISPLPRTQIAQLLNSRPRAAVLTVEEHSLHGGIGDIIARVIAEEGLPRRFRSLGIPAGEFSVAGPRAKIRAHYGIDAEGINVALSSLEG